MHTSLSQPKVKRFRKCIWEKLQNWKDISQNLYVFRREYKSVQATSPLRSAASLEYTEFVSMSLLFL